MTSLAFYIFGDLVLVVWALGSSVAVQLVLMCKLNTEVEDFSLYRHNPIL